MKQYFKHISTAFFLTVAAFSVVISMQGCKSKCGNTTCQNGGTCNNDTCTCPSGYRGTSCETTWSSAYLGSYTCTQTCTPSVTNASFKSTVTAGSSNSSYTISISNFGNLQATANATIDANNNVTISGSNIAGNGVFANGVLTVHYTTNTNNVPGYTCNMSMVKD